ncbi:hypothetical protein CMI47_12580, partial [Candidatus Pacearchaeota archaeon]|nr:hypothetical protein [Candidatus Pacearchaeota archaeon]
NTPLPKEVENIVKEALEENDPKAYLEEAKKAEPRESIYMDLTDAKLENAFAYEGQKNPIEKHKLIYDTSSLSLEQMYFWILDFMVEEFISSEKLTDNFVSSATSGHFAEMGTRQTRLQDEAMKMLGSVNQVVKSILNIVYDLKEFELRLEHYKGLKSENKGKKESAILSLKQIWMDTVDIKRGNTAIKMMAQQYDYVTIIDAFMAAESMEKVKDIDLNDRVKRILQQRLAEFEKWITESERELTKRFDIEKKYLKSQINTVKLYSRWIKPYLNSIKDLEQRADLTSSLVNSFNTTLFELTIIGHGKFKLEKEIGDGNLPEETRKKDLRKYEPITVVEFKFRSVPERSDQRGGYGFRGRAEVTFTSYSLNEDELRVLKDQLEKSDIGDMMSLIEGATTESLSELQDDIDRFLSDKPPKESDPADSKSEDTNPFSALLSPLLGKRKSKKKKSESEDSLEIKEDNAYEKAIRSRAIIKGRVDCVKIYGAFKGSYDMAGFR